MDQKKMKIIVTDTPANTEVKDVVFVLEGRAIGSGYKNKSDNRISIVRCPICHKENYALAIATGRCSFCNFDPNLYE